MRREPCAPTSCARHSIFDGDCGICRTWVDYWRAADRRPRCISPLPGGGGRFPRISPPRISSARCSSIEPDGRVYAGAAATFRLLSYAPGAQLWWWLYRYRAGLRAAERGGLLASSRTRRGLLTRVTHLLWGRTLEPAALRRWSRGCSCAGSALIYLAAFVSLGVQIRGARRQRRHPAARRVPRRRARRLGRRRLLALADAVLARRQRHRADRPAPSPASRSALLVALGIAQRPALIGAVRRSTCPSSTPGRSS